MASEQEIADAKDAVIEGMRKLRDSGALYSGEGRRTIVDLLVELEALESPLPTRAELSAAVYFQEKRGPLNVTHTASTRIVEMAGAYWLRWAAARANEHPVTHADHAIDLLGWADELEVRGSEG